MEASNSGQQSQNLVELRVCPVCASHPRFPAGRVSRLCPAFRGGRRPRQAGAETSRRETPVPLYECVFIARSDVTQQQVEAIADQVAAQLETDGGAVKKREYWGLRSLAYRIKKNRKGHYMLLGLDARPPSVVEMERQLRLNEDILRFMTVNVEAIEEAPSAILSRKSDDRDRGFRGPKPAGRFDSGRRRGFDDREEFRARDRESFPDDFRPPSEE